MIFDILAFWLEETITVVLFPWVPSKADPEEDFRLEAGLLGESAGRLRQTKHPMWLVKYFFVRPKLEAEVKTKGTDLFLVIRVQLSQKVLFNFLDCLL